MNALFQGIILTGGKSKRMGNDKAFLKYKDSNFLTHEIDVLKKQTRDLMVVGDPNKYKNYANTIVGDLIPGCGPAGGIYTGLHYSTYEYNIVLSCDVPQIDSELIQLLKNSYNGEDALICQYNDQLHPLIGIYNKKICSHIKKSIESGKLRLLDILKDLDCTFLKVPEYLSNQLSNINTKEEYEHFIRRAYK